MCSVNLGQHAVLAPASVHVGTKKRHCTSTVPLEWLNEAAGDMIVARAAHICKLIVTQQFGHQLRE
jgi:hypothetical protein